MVGRSVPLLNFRYRVYQPVLVPAEAEPTSFPKGDISMSVEDFSCACACACACACSVVGREEEIELWKWRRNRNRERLSNRRNSGIVGDDAVVETYEDVSLILPFLQVLCLNTPAHLSLPPKKGGV